MKYIYILLTNFIGRSILIICLLQISFLSCLFAKNGRSGKSVIHKSNEAFPPDYRSKVAIYEGKIDKEITGKVTDNKGNPLAGVNVAIKGTSQGTVTDANGDYHLMIPDENALLVFTFIGYEKVEKAIVEQTQLNVVMEQAANQLANVVIVGYGTQDARALTSSVATIKNENLKDIKATSFEQLMIGQMAGVQVQQSTGQPGAGLEIRIRGTGSISALNDPLYVVDGFPIESPGYNNRVNILSFINPSDIESITVLKDAASTSIYGARGSNGVVLITTKKGKSGKTTIGVNAWYGIQQLPKRGLFKVMNAEENAQWKIEAAQDAATLAGVPFDPNSVPTIYQNVKGPGTNWFELLEHKNAPAKDFNITLQSGNEKSKLYISSDYYKIDGALIGTDYERFSLRLNGEVNLNSKIHYGIQVNPSYSFRNLGSILGTEGFALGGMSGIALTASPLATPYFPDGSLNPEIKGGPDNFVYANPLNVFNKVTNIRNDFRLLVNNYLEIELLKGLTLKSSLGADLNMSNSRSFSPSSVGVWWNWWLPGASIAIPGDQSTGSAGRDQFTTWMFENYLTYRASIGKDHDLEILLGHTVQKQDYNSISVNGTRFPSDNIPYVSAALPGIYRDGQDGSDAFRYALQSVFGRVNYNYKKRYFANATFRRDGSSRFSPKSRWGTFPSASLGWLISDEPFMKSLLHSVDELKLRSSYGITGNNNIASSFAYISGINPSNYVLGNQLAIGNYAGFADEGLKWESSKEFDLGLDLSFLNRRISITADYYKRITYDLLLNRPIPTLTGFGSAISNVGKLQNKGFELSISSKNIINKNFNWETSLNVSVNRNKVLALSGNNDPIRSGNDFDGYSVTEIGKPMGLIYGYIENGVYKDEAEAVKDHNHNPGAHAGTLKVMDVNNDGQITPADITYIGNPWPKFTFGMSNTVSYHDLDFAMQIMGSVGNKIFINAYEYLRNMDGVFNVLADVKDRWRSPNQPGNGIYPTTNYPDQRAYVRLPNSNWVKDGSYIDINNITVGYTFHSFKPKKAFNPSSARAYITIQNALIISKIPLNNPNANWHDGRYDYGGMTNMGFQFGNYPLPRMFTAGVNFSF